MGSNVSKSDCFKQWIQHRNCVYTVQDTHSTRSDWINLLQTRKERWREEIHQLVHKWFRSTTLLLFARRRSGSAAREYTAKTDDSLIRAKRCKGWFISCPVVRIRDVPPVVFWPVITDNGNRKLFETLCWFCNNVYVFKHFTPAGVWMREYECSSLTRMS